LRIEHFNAGQKYAPYPALPLSLVRQNAAPCLRAAPRSQLQSNPGGPMLSCSSGVLLHIGFALPAS